MAKKDKGKSRAVDNHQDPPTESSPLLGSPSHSRSQASTRSRLADDDRALPLGIFTSTRAQTRTSVLYIALIIVISLLAGCILSIALLANSFRPSSTELESLQDTAFQYSAPDSISVVNVTEEGVLVNVSLRAGIDWDQAVGIKRWTSEDERQEAADRGDRGTGAEWWETLRRWTAGKVIRRLDSRIVKVQVPESVLVLPEHFTTIPLLSLSIPHDIDVPLVIDVTPQRTDWLKPVHALALAKPIASTGDLMAFAQKAWELGEVRVVVGVPKVQVSLPVSGWLAKFAHMEKEDITKYIHMAVPRLPGLPWPGKPLNLSSLVHLDSYVLHTRADGLHIAAAASLPNPLPGMNATVPFHLPFSIHLPDGQEMANVVTAPVQLGSWSPRIDIGTSGVVVANLSGKLKGKHDDSTLSHFFQNYLHGLDSPISVNGLSQLPAFAQNEIAPPRWLLASLPSLSIPLSFPGPKPKPKIIQSVTIEHMRLSESGGKMLASGLVIAEISLPKGMESVDVSIDAVKPDILIFDGPPPDPEDDPEDDNEEDYPARAFGHIKPDEYLASTSERFVNPEHPDWIVVRAPMEDIPVEILRGRDGVMRAFVSKVVFKGGALAGIRGDADVRVTLKGVKGELALGGLPVKGEVWVGRQRNHLPWSMHDVDESEAPEL